MQARTWLRQWTPGNSPLRVQPILVLLGLGLLAAASAPAASGKDEKPSGQMVDSGSFGVFINGHRVATETFSIQQNANGSSVTSEFKSEAGLDKAVQTSEWQMTGSGELRKYEWNETSPGQSQATVLPNQEFLIERFKSGPLEKEQEQPFLLPASSSLLDDYFFVQREVLAWKFLASSCPQEKGVPQCPKQPVQFGALNPHARSSLSVGVGFAGRDKVTIRGVERELIRLNMKIESADWALWLDDQFKLQRILISGENTEVVRD